MRCVPTAFFSIFETVSLLSTSTAEPRCSTCKEVILLPASGKRLARGVHTRLVADSDRRDARPRRAFSFFSFKSRVAGIRPVSSLSRPGPFIYNVDCSRGGGVMLRAHVCTFMLARVPLPFSRSVGIASSLFGDDYSAQGFKFPRNPTQVLASLES